MGKVENLKKITLDIQTGMSPEHMDYQGGVRQYEFVFGIATEGMTPFEFELVGKHQGESVFFKLNKAMAPMFFEHLNLPVWDLFNARKDIFLKVTVTSVVPATEREILKAMTDAVHHGGGGCGGDCGCGCG